MRRPPATAKRDIAEPEVVTTLQAAGATVYRMDKPLDLLVGFRGRTYIVEVKTGKAKLKVGQAQFIEEWRGAAIPVLRNGQDAIDWLSDVSSEVK